MKQTKFIITENIPLAPGVMRMKMLGDTSDITGPGQFVNIKLDGLFLRRPISVCDLNSSALTLIYKVVGTGTRQLAGMKVREHLDVLTGLGNGYDTSVSGNTPLLIGGGVGVPPLFWLAKELIAQGKQVTVILGFNTKSEIFYEEEFRRLGATTLVTTADGSYGIGGFVTGALPGLTYSYYYTCGPEPMLRAVYRACEGSGQLSFERRMGCGFGACMGCSCRTITGYKRICKEGPVMRKEEILWED